MTASRQKASAHVYDDHQNSDQRIRCGVRWLYTILLTGLGAILYWQLTNRHWASLTEELSMKEGICTVLSAESIKDGTGLRPYVMRMTIQVDFESFENFTVTTRPMTRRFREDEAIDFLKQYREQLPTPIDCWASSAVLVDGHPDVTFKEPYYFGESSDLLVWGAAVLIIVVVVLACVYEVQCAGLGLEEEDEFETDESASD